MYLPDRYVYPGPWYETACLITLPESFPEWKYTGSDSFCNRHQPDFLLNHYCEILGKSSRPSRPQVSLVSKKKKVERRNFMTSTTFLGSQHSILHNSGADLFSYVKCIRRRQFSQLFILCFVEVQTTFHIITYDSCLADLQGLREMVLIDCTDKTSPL